MLMIWQDRRQRWTKGSDELLLILMTDLAPGSPLVPAGLTTGKPGSEIQRIQERARQLSRSTVTKPKQTRNAWPFADRSFARRGGISGLKSIVPNPIIEERYESTALTASVYVDIIGLRYRQSMSPWPIFSEISS